MKRSLVQSDVYRNAKYRLQSDMTMQSLIMVDPEVLGGTPVFKGTRVPVATLFAYLEDDYSLEEFLECFPTVSREVATRVLEQSKDALLEPA